ncbi:hypothetical protein F5884DRAFT_671620 [Xylogone sp. PMI_703]|nr:hypothetical protein F5884DRAFT_671620 [Xylogone sp. PMI_703]
MGISDEKAQEKVDGPTPVSKHPAGTFSSEPRPTAETPLLRSRRGQTISSAVSDPARKTSKAWSVEETPSEKYTENSNGSNGNGSSTGLSLSPPKMRSLVAGNGNGASTLTPINEADPFNGTTKPPVEVALDQKNLPFSESCRLARPSKAGVIRIRNIPYSVTRTEVLAFLGRNARLLNENEAEPIHIIMERVTSKTLDCYAEFTSLTEAINAVERYEIHRSGGRGGKLGQRHVEIELSSQEALMKELFPKAKNVKWQGARPIIYPSDPEDQYNSGFQGFTSREEMVMLVKHVESPQRSPFSKDCPQRPFECLVSTLTKYPWYMVDHITIDERNRIHHATKELVALLVNHIERYPEDLCLTPQLLKRVWKAALRCPGFTPAMKDDIVYLCRIDDDTARLYGVPPYAPYWKYLWTIGAKPNVPDDLLLWYITIIREHTQPKTQLSLAEQAAREDPDCNAVKLFGDLEKHIQYGKDFSEQTLGVVARAEWAAIEKVLREALE